MIQRRLAQDLLHSAEKAYRAHPAMMEFAPFASDIAPQIHRPFHCSCSEVFRNDRALSSRTYARLTNAIRDFGPFAHWRETYKDTDIGAQFMELFACFCIIGENAPFISNEIRLFMVYMPPRLYYPWHHHPAEEVYLVIAGEAVFRRVGSPDETLGEGDTSYHESNQPHAMETFDQPVLCLVAWHDNFDTPPVLTNTSIAG